MAPDWRDDLVKRLTQRNEREVRPFTKIVECFSQIHRQNQVLRTQNAYQEKELTILRHEAATAATETRDEKVTKLQRKVQQLQEELNHMFRGEREGAASQLNLTQELQDVIKRSMQTRDELEAATVELEGFREREPRLIHEAQQAQSDLQLVKGELGRVQAMLEASEKERMDVRKQNDDLIERIVGEKSRNAEEMNKMNETVEKLRAALKALQLQLEGMGQGGDGSRGRGGSLSLSASSSSVTDHSTELPTNCGSPFKAHSGDVNAIAYAPTGAAFATAGNDALVRVWHGSSGSLLATLRGGTEPMLSVDLYGEWALAGSSDFSVRMWDTKTSRCTKTLVGHSGNVYAARFLGDNKSVITGAADRTVRVWDTGRAVVRQVLRSGSTCNGLDVSSDGVLPVSAHQDGNVRLWDLRAGSAKAIINAFETQATSVAYGRDYCVLANSRDNAIKVIDTRTYETLYTLRHGDYRSVLNWSAAAWSPSNTYVAAGSGNNALMIWDVRTGELKASLSGHQAPLTNVAWWAFASPGEKRLATCDRTGHVCMWT